MRSHKLEVAWVASRALVGPHDYLDVFEAPSNDVAMQVPPLIRTFGHAHTEIWPASSRERFKDLVCELSVDEGEEARGWTRG